MFTVEIYKADKRVKKNERFGKNKVGFRFIEAKDFSTREDVIEAGFELVKQGYTLEIHQTYVTRKNMMSGVEFQERYDTPSFCSPSSESYWSM